MTNESGQTVHVTMEGKSVAVAYILWFFIGIWSGAHRFYLGCKGTAIAQLLLFWGGILTLFFLFGIPLIIAGIWWIVDAFLIPSRAAEYNRSHGALVSGAVGFVSNAPAKNPENEELDTLERLYDLREKGVITDEEYTQRKGNVGRSPA